MLGAIPCRLGPYEQHDLVSLDPQTVGVIVECGPDSCQVLILSGNLTEDLQRGCHTLRCLKPCLKP